MTEKILPQDQQRKPEHRESSPLRSQTRKTYKTFIPQSKILKKVEFQKQHFFIIASILFNHLQFSHFHINMLKTNSIKSSSKSAYKKHSNLSPYYL